MQAYSLSRIVSDARTLTRSARVSLAEVLFVFSHTQLNEVEKILWILFATHADDALSCTFSYAQISYCVNLDHETVHRALKRLMAMGFLDCEGLLDTFTQLRLLQVIRFHLQLPLEGLLSLSRSCVTKPEKLRRPITINLLHNRFEKRF